MAYEPWASQAVRKVRGGEYELAFVLKALLVEEMWEVARRRERVPPKSTYSYPKIKPGIILGSL